MQKTFGSKWMLGCLWVCLISSLSTSLSLPNQVSPATNSTSTTGDNDLMAIRMNLQADQIKSANRSYTNINNGIVFERSAGEDYEYDDSENSDQEESLGLLESLVDEFLVSDVNFKDKNAHDVWIAFGGLLERFTERMYKTFFPKIIEHSYDLNLSPSCMGTALQFVLALRKRKTWAMKVLDAWGKLPAGILEGTVSDFGNYDECLSITTDDIKDGYIGVPFRSQYCMINFVPPLPPLRPEMTLKTKVFNFTNTKLEGTVIEDISLIVHGLYKRGGRIGLCLPLDCSKEDVQNVIDKTLGRFKVDIRVVHCEAKKELKFDKIQIAALTILSALGFLVLFSTVVDIIGKTWKQKDKHPKSATENRKTSMCLPNMVKFCASFSAVQNTKQLFNTNNPSSTINALCGMKLLSMLWLVFNHTYLVPLLSIYANSREYFRIVEELWFQGVINGWVPVDTFFFMGALLFSYTCLHKIEKSGGQVNYVRIVFNRFMRLCFPVWLMVLFAFLWPTIGSGPLWHEVTEAQVSKCRKHWWATAFFFSNWMTAKTICLQQTWYVAADLQLFLAFLPMLVIFYKWPKVGVGLCIGIVNIGIVASGLNTYIPNTYPTPIYNILDYELVDELIESTFLRTYLHMSPYALGIIVGYMLHKDRNVKISKYILAIGWIMSASLCIASVWVTQPWNAGYPVEPVTSVIYSSLHKTTWTIGIAWIVYVCATGNGGWVNSFLSWKLFVILSRLCFMLYLSHFYVIWTRQGLLRERPYFSHYAMVCDFVVNSVFGLIVAYFLYLLVESPVSCLLRNYFAFKITEMHVKKPSNIGEDNVLNSRL